jgi:hypothetical protein
MAVLAVDISTSMIKTVVFDDGTEVTVSRLANTVRRPRLGWAELSVPFGYSVIREDRPQPWGQGLALHALAAGTQCGVGGS